jgi:predicted lipid-binding transport protein (Tim44 family)
LPDDRKIEWAKSLMDAEDLLIGASIRSSGSPAETVLDVGRLNRARAVFQEMQRQYASGDYAKYGELLQQLEKLLISP